MNLNRASLVFAALLSLAGCSYQLVSPPARMVSLDSARTAAPGETVAGVHAAGYAAVFDPSVGVGSVGIRRGVTERIEVDADATWARVVYDGFPDIDCDIFAGRVGGKLANGRGWGALTAGVGGGYAPAAGGFTALDVGAVVSYPNCFAVPFADGTTFASVPIGARQVDFRNVDGTLAGSDKADPTFGFGLAAGVEIPLDRARCRRGLTPARVQLGVGGNSLFPTDGTIRTTTTASDGTITTSERGGRYGVVGIAVGVELPF